MKKYIFMLLILLMPLTVQAYEAEWKELGVDNNTTSNYTMYYMSGTVTIDGVDCKVISAKSSYGSYDGVGMDCNFPSTGGGGTRNGADVNIDNSKKGN